MNLITAMIPKPLLVQSAWKTFVGRLQLVEMWTAWKHSGTSGSILSYIDFDVHPVHNGNRRQCVLADRFNDHWSSVHEWKTTTLKQLSWNDRLVLSFAHIHTFDWRTQSNSVSPRLLGFLIQSLKWLYRPLQRNKGGSDGRLFAGFCTQSPQ